MFDIDVPIQNFEGICRVCLTQSEHLISIHEIVFTHSHNAGHTQDVLLIEVFQKYCNISVYQDDQKPQNICETCVTMVAKAFNIFEAFCESNELLDQILEKHGSKLGTEEISAKLEEFSFLPAGVLKEDECKNDYDSDLNKENSKIIPKVHLEELTDEGNKDEFCYKVVIDSDIEDISTDSQGSITNINDEETEDSGLNNLEGCNEIKLECSEDFISSQDFVSQDAEVEPALKKIRLEIPDETVNLPKMGREKWDHTYYISENALMKVVQGSIGQKSPIFTIQSGSSNVISEYTNQSIIPLPYGSENGIFNCRFCEGLILQGMGEVIEHMKAVHPLDGECILCTKKFSQIKVLLSHVVSHADQLDLFCKQCSIYFEDKESLEAHYKSKDHMKNVTTMCNICNKDFKQDFYLKRHVREVHLDQEQGVCPKCGLFIKFRSNLERHLRKHLEKRNFLCEHCSKGFLAARPLKKHVLIEHGLEYRLEKAKVSKKQDGDKLLSKLSDQGKKRVELFACEYCPETFGTRSTFFRHRISHPECRGISCPFCDAILDNPDEYKDHRTNDHSDYVCDVCQKGWPSKSYLDQHKYNTHRARTYKCAVCPKSFKFSQSLKTHETTHTDRKPFACHFCEKRFRQRTHLVQHETCMHMKSKKHQCGICEKSFTYNSGLKAHLRSHIGLRPFSCPYCDRSYTDTIGRHKHVKSTHPEKMEEFLIFKKNNQSDESRIADSLPHTEVLKSEWLSAKTTGTAPTEQDLKKEYSEYEYEEDCLREGDLHPSEETHGDYSFMDVMDENSSAPSSDSSMNE